MHLMGRTSIYTIYHSISSNFLYYMAWESYSLHKGIQFPLLGTSCTGFGAPGIQQRGMDLSRLPFDRRRGERQDHRGER